MGLDHPLSVRIRDQSSLSHFHLGFGSATRHGSFEYLRDPKYMVRPSSVKHGRSSAESWSGSWAGTATRGAGAGTCSVWACKYEVVSMMNEARLIRIIQDISVSKFILRTSYFSGKTGSRALKTN